MAKLLSLLAYAGDKVSARAAVVADLSACAIRSVQHGDRAFVADTLAALSGKSRPVVALSALLPVLADSLKAVNDGGKARAAVVLALAGRVDNLGKKAGHTDSVKAHAAHGLAVSVSALADNHFPQGVAKDKEAKKAQGAAAEAFGAAVGAVFAQAMDDAVKALAPARADKPADTTSTVDTTDTAGADPSPFAAPATDTHTGKGIDWQGRTMAARARTRRAVAIARKARETVREQAGVIAALQARIDAMEAAAVVTVKAARKAKTLQAA